MQNRSTKKKPVAGKTAPNPTYVKIGKRIRQARLMAKESNSRQLGQRLGWSAGRTNNFERIRSRRFRIRWPDDASGT